MKIENILGLTPEIINSLDQNPDLELSLGDRIYRLVLKENAELRGFPYTASVRVQKIGEEVISYCISFGKNREDALLGISLSFRNAVLNSQR